MDCCICSPMVSVYRPPRNSICSSCYDGAKSMIAFLNELDGGGSKCLLAKASGWSWFFFWTKQVDDES